MASERKAPATLIADQLGLLILKGDIAPGSRITERDVAERFAVSRGPVREALRILESRTLIRLEPMRGATVMSLDDGEAVECVELAALVFGLACKKAIARGWSAAPAKAKLWELEDLVDHDPDGIRFYKKTIIIGEMIVDGARGAKLKSLLYDLRYGVPYIYGKKSFQTPLLRRIAANKWRHLLDSIDFSDAEKAFSLALELYDDALDAARIATSS